MSRNVLICFIFILIIYIQDLSAAVGVTVTLSKMICFVFNIKNLSVLIFSS